MDSVLYKKSATEVVTGYHVSFFPAFTIANCGNHLFRRGGYQVVTPVTIVKIWKIRRLLFEAMSVAP